MTRDREEAKASQEEVEHREQATLRRLLLTPPTPHKPKPESAPGASPKKEAQGCWAPIERVESRWLFLHRKNDRAAA